MTHNDSYQHQLNDLQQSFSDQFQERLADLIHYYHKLMEHWDQESVDGLLGTAHKIAGASLSLGFTRIGISAQMIETIVNEIKTQNNPTEFEINKARQAVSERIELIRIAAKEDKPERLDESINAVTSMQDSRAGRLIYLVEDDLDQAQEIARQIGYFGYSVRVFNTLTEMKDSLSREIPSTILMDIIFPEGETAGADFISNIWDRIPKNVHVIFISVRDDINTRLKAARAGGQAYFPKPINIGLLIDVLDRLMVVEEKLPYRIMIVDDDNLQASVNSKHLKRAGMETCIITDPLTIIQSLKDFNPDLILLDMYMPNCSGMELAVIIRQIEAFVSIPIVYLSAETDREKQLEAVGLGGDDFLTKPIKPNHLISAVTSRVDRYRQLRYLMIRDSLTGLLNHTTFKERFSQEFNRSIRLNKPLTYAMIDLDGFKQVNDTYGHTAGDRVIKSLASMLTKRLRISDIVGRYGGEEFGIVLPNTDSKEAAKILDELRYSFNHIRHNAANGEFMVTFSCGLASYPECTTPSGLAEAADKALYQAKRSGKNRIGFNNSETTELIQ